MLFTTTSRYWKQQSREKRSEYGSGDLSPAYDVLVLWSRKEYELFRQAMHDCGHRLSTAKVVLLEELLGAVVRPRKRGAGCLFQQVLRAFHVQTTWETFYQPKYRAGFLLELWDRVSQLAAQSEEWTQTELCLNPRTNTVHLPGCSHLGLMGGQPRTPQVLLKGPLAETAKRRRLYLWEMERSHAVKFQPHAGAWGRRRIIRRHRSCSTGRATRKSFTMTVPASAKTVPEAGLSAVEAAFRESRCGSPRPDGLRPVFTAGHPVWQTRRR